MTPACSFAVSRTHVVTILEGIDLAEGDLMKYPSISLRAIAADPEGANKIIGPLKWMEIKRPAQFLRSLHGHLPYQISWNVDVRLALDTPDVQPDGR